MIICPKKFISLFAWTFFLATTLHAQLFPASQEPEVRRAIPLSTPDASSSPKSTPLPIAAPPQDIRIAPANSSDPFALAEAQLAVANGFFSRKQPEAAVREYEKFLQMTSPGQPDREEALFRLGESHRKLGHEFAAQEAYQQLLKETPSGNIAAAAAYRQGEYYQSRKETKSAVTSFAQATTLSSDPAIKNAARYQQALCCDQLGEANQASTLFEEISKEDNPNRNSARMALAAHDEKIGNKEKALATYEVMGAENTAAIAAEALVKAGKIAHDLGKKEQAKQLFEKAADLSNGGEWGGIAALGLMKLADEEKDYPKILKRSNQAITYSNLEGRSQALLLTAQTQRQLGNLKEALSLYDQLLRECPGTDAARNAPFARLLVLQGLLDPKLLSQVEAFLVTASDPHQHAQAQLLKAETLFQTGNYAPAAEAYSSLKSSDLTPELKAEALYKESWSRNQTGDLKGALDLLSQWMLAVPQSPQMPSALIQRAMLEQKTGDLSKAIADYSTVIEHYPEARERELALQQKALLQGQQQDNKGMTATFQQLLQAYPNSKAAAQANFWIGWSLFEAKDYVGAISYLEKARTLDAKSFGERAGLRLLLCHYYLEQVSEALHEASLLKIEALPAEVLQWLGLKAYEQGNLMQTEQWLTAVNKSGKPELLTSEVEKALAHAYLKQEKFREAEIPAAKCLEFATDPSSRAEALLTLATLRKELKKYKEADTLLQEALLLQPEGKLNMKVRLLLADLLFAQQDYDGAARAYRRVAFLTEDTKIAPQALRKAAEAYRRAKNPIEAQKATEELNAMANRSKLQ